MDRIQKKYLYDISESIRIIIEDYLLGIENLDQYEADLKTQDAVERRYMIISEALYKIRRKGVELPFANEIINRRNTMAHQYDEIKPRKIWNSLVGELPGLKVEADRLLAE
ncbi:MAG: HepT-like ribonuclease domain-containing protein [Bacteroidota bacterium]